ncbi:MULTISPECIES: TolC family protein [unclassified Siphonobacter]|uniref:TolC family protein n=1 Tax=unclassified Siphonobacter TaxID=2635712 RepID=UPI000CABC97B|nr:MULTISPECIES: TolC family protein [unclassified Siphonobacter]MDQ1086114.1 outer membrane protein [Siphonobacter sp. SORGH_AS_1065]MDR6196437.1 outer membrane protein [Siphonobacter sp. SORGH_AS_0500]PKK35225.1 hypothetical protein BWI96_17855 [Siphonobacter sp. SORGH_AS_0500]
MRRRIAYFLCCFAINFSLFAQTVSENLTLEDAITIALDKNYAIKVAKNQVRLAENDNTRGNAGMLPLVTAVVQPNGLINYTNQRFFDAVRPPLVQRGVFNRNVQGNLTATWTIFDGLSMYITKDRLEELVRAGESQAQVTIESTIAQVTNAYYAAVQQGQQTRFLEDALVISRERRRLAKDRYDIGQGSKVEYLTAQVDFNADTATLIAQQLSFTNTKTQLNQLLARSLDINFNPQDTLLVNRDLIYETLKEQTLSQNPQLMLARHNSTIANLDVKNQKALLWPNVNLLGGYTYNRLRNGGSGFGVRSGTVGNITGGVQVTAVIFDGLNQHRRIQGARINEEIIKLQEEDLRVQVESGLRQAYENYRNNLNLLDLESINTKTAQQNVNIALERYKIGVAAPLELREAQRNFVAAEIRLLQAQYNAKVSEIELYRLSSQIVK